MGPVSLWPEDFPAQPATPSTPLSLASPLVGIAIHAGGFQGGEIPWAGAATGGSMPQAHPGQSRTRRRLSAPAGLADVEEPAVSLSYRRPSDPA